MSKRMSVTLEPEDDGVVAAFGVAGSDENTSLRAWAELRGHSVADSPSEAALLRLLIRAGAEALREQALDVGYAQLAIEMDGYATESRAARERYVRRTDRHRPG